MKQLIKSVIKHFPVMCLLVNKYIHINLISREDNTTHFGTMPLLSNRCVVRSAWMSSDSITN